MVFHEVLARFAMVFGGKAPENRGHAFASLRDAVDMMEGRLNAPCPPPNQSVDFDSSRFDVPSPLRSISRDIFSHSEIYLLFFIVSAGFSESKPAKKSLEGATPGIENPKQAENGHRDGNGLKTAAQRNKPQLFALGTRATVFLCVRMFPIFIEMSAAHLSTWGAISFQSRFGCMDISQAMLTAATIRFR